MVMPLMLSKVTGAAVRSSAPTIKNEQASGKPVGHHPGHGQKQDIRFGGDNPNTPDC